MLRKLERRFENNGTRTPLIERLGDFVPSALIVAGTLTAIGTVCTLSYCSSQVYEEHQYPSIIGTEDRR